MSRLRSIWMVLIMVSGLVGETSNAFFTCLPFSPSNKARHSLIESLRKRRQLRSMQQAVKTLRADYAIETVLVRRPPRIGEVLIISNSASAATLMAELALLPVIPNYRNFKFFVYDMLPNAQLAPQVIVQGERTMIFPLIAPTEKPRWIIERIVEALIKSTLPTANQMWIASSDTEGSWQDWQP